MTTHIFIYDVEKHAALLLTARLWHYSLLKRLGAIA